SPARPPRRRPPPRSRVPRGHPGRPGNAPPRRRRTAMPGPGRPRRPHADPRRPPAPDPRSALVTDVQRPAGEPTTSMTAPARRAKGRVIADWLSTTDHKKIGYLYLIASFVFFSLAGLMAMVVRGELAEPGLQVVSNEQYNQMFTMHGTIMMFFFATPLFAGFANVIMPLQIGAPDVAFPRLNALSFWLFLFGALIAVSAFLTSEGAASFGWTGYPPLSDD